MGKSLKLIGFIYGNTELDLEEITAEACTDEGRQILNDAMASINDKSNAPHPPCEILSAWPQNKDKSIDEHMKSCARCRIEWLEARIAAVEFTRSNDFTKDLARSSVPTSLIDKIMNRFSEFLHLAPGTLRWAVPVAASFIAVVAAGYLILRNDVFPIPIASKAEQNVIAGLKPSTETGFGFGGESRQEKFKELWPMRAGIASAMIRDFRHFGQPDDVKDVLLSLKNCGDNMPSEILRKVSEGNDPCTAMSPPNRNLCRNSLELYKMSRSEINPDNRYSKSLAELLKPYSDTLSPEIRRIVNSEHPEFTAINLKRLVKQDLW